LNIYYGAFANLTEVKS